MVAITGAHASNTAFGPHIQVSLLSEKLGLAPGKTQWLGIYLEPEHHWHTYWRNPGDSGEPPKVEWQLHLAGNDAPIAAEIGGFHWPIPKEIPVAHLVNYGYEGANLLMVPVTLPEEVSTGQNVTVTADLSWLVCKEDCIPGWATLTLSLPIASESQQSTHATLFESTRKKWPDKQRLKGLFEVTEKNLTLSVDESIQGTKLSEAGQSEWKWRLLPFRSDVMQHNGQQLHQIVEQTHSFILDKSDYFSDTPDSLRFLLTNGNVGYEFQAEFNKSGRDFEHDTSLDITPDLALPLMMLFALAGGVILNLMPCVLPVLAIKALSVGNRQQSLGVKLGYLFGVLVSFAVFALLIEVLKSAGEAVGWGFHMQEPVVIILLCFLFLYLALMLIDIAPGGNRLTGIGQNLTQGSQFSSQFFTGVLAVVVASPCTAPFMGVALGAAMVSTPLSSLLIFLSLGLGFAMPLTLIFFNQRLSAVIPKPGAWMVTFKQFLAFPMLATLVWLLWVFQGQAGGSEQAILMVALLLFALFFWALPKANKIVSAILAIIVLMPLYLLVQSKPDAVQTNSTSHIAWTVQKMQSLKDENQVVLVNMTADWCITCKVNEQVAFKTDEFDSLLSNQNLHYLVGDWTNKNQEILAFLNQYERAGVPLYVIYAGNHYQEVLPQILTPQILRSAVVGALENQQAQEQL